MYSYCYVFCFIVLFYALFVCKCVLNYCHRVSTQLQVTNISNMCCAFVGLDRKLYKTHGTYIKMAVTCFCLTLTMREVTPTLSSPL